MVAAMPDQTALGMALFALGSLTAGAAASDLLLSGARVSRLALGVLGVLVAFIGSRLVLW